MYSKHYPASLPPAVVTVFILLVLASLLPLSADDSSKQESKTTLEFNSFVQTWFTTADGELDPAGEPDKLYGFSLPRLRLNPFGTFGRKLSWRMTFSWDRLESAILDAYIDYELSATFSLRAGLFPVPGAISGELTPVEEMDCVDTAMITQSWNLNTGLREYRSIGIMASGSFMQNWVHFRLMVGNSSGANPLDIRLSEAVYRFPDSGLKFWGRIETRPLQGLDIGAFFSNTIVDNQETKNYSFGANLSFNLDRLFIKMEYIAGEYGLTDHLTEWRGFWMTVCYRMKRFCPVFRYDSYTPAVDFFDGMKVNRYDQITLGISYQASEALQFKAGIIFRKENDLQGEALKLRNNLLTLSLQYSFGGKIL